MRLRIEYLPNYNRAWGDIKKAHETDAGFDLRAAVPAIRLIAPGENFVCPLGIATIFDNGYEAQLRARSGLALKNGIGLVNGVGTVDSGYRGEWACILHNFGNEVFILHPGDRICQVVFNKYTTPTIDVGPVTTGEDDRQGGFGSTGVA